MWSVKGRSVKCGVQCVVECWSVVVECWSVEGGM